jgi:large subunit GTPase 1
LNFIPRRIWADYFDGQGIQYAFFSAANAAALQQARRDAIAQAEEEQLQDEASLSDSDGPDTPSDSVSDDDFAEESVPESPSHSESETEDEHQYVLTEEDSPDGKDPRTKVLSVLELEDLFVTAAPDLSSEARLFF